ncbi:hypothetical protein F2Q69_00015942 [Brassica cretica]|uniref:Uncharacterized protein n=1 Tax=Brassica cretica TaxID=69181 RepID=A0A8S9R8J8_BRACR|nr:hypothetical protein F2Q69_00015942 [Brassica cretica]
MEGWLLDPGFLFREKTKLSLVPNDSKIRVLVRDSRTQACGFWASVRHKICSAHILASPSIDGKGASSIDSPSPPRQLPLTRQTDHASALPWEYRSHDARIFKQVSGSEVTVKELHDKILESVNVKRSVPPNAWLWSLIESCQCQDDINLLFEVLQKLRRFRLSNLRLHDNFNSNLCQQVAKTCVRVGAIDSGKKALWKHNVLGLTPSVASAHHLLVLVSIDVEVGQLVSASSALLSSLDPCCLLPYTIM